MRTLLVDINMTKKIKATRYMKHSFSNRIVQEWNNIPSNIGNTAVI